MNTHLRPSRHTDATVVEYIVPEDSSILSLSQSGEPLVVRLEVDAELRLAHTFEDGISGVDLVDDPNEQIRRYGRVTFRRVK